MTKLMERDGKISDLSARAERLETDSEMFQVMPDSVPSLYLTQFCLENNTETEGERDDEEYQNTVVIISNIDIGPHCDSPHCLSSVIKPRQVL